MLVVCFVCFVLNVYSRFVVCFCFSGSERVGKTGAEGDRMEEAKAINKSLSALGDVIGALTSGQKHVPYRNHKLTMLLSDSLGGNAKTLMFVNVSPVDYNFNETCNSLAFASRVKKVVNNSSKSVSMFFLVFLAHVAIQVWLQ